MYKHNQFCSRLCSVPLSTNSRCVEILESFNILFYIISFTVVCEVVQTSKLVKIYFGYSKSTIGSLVNICRNVFWANQKFYFYYRKRYFSNQTAPLWDRILHATLNYNVLLTSFSFFWPSQQLKVPSENVAIFALSFVVVRLNVLEMGWFLQPATA